MNGQRQAMQMALEALRYGGAAGAPRIEAAIEALHAALSAQEPTSEQGWLHRIDMEKTAAWQQGYAQGLYRASKSQQEPIAWLWYERPGRRREHLKLVNVDPPPECAFPVYTHPPPRHN